MTKNYKLFTVFVMGFMYIFIGIKHFTEPQFFINITPPQVPFKTFAVYFTGFLEILGGALILNSKSRQAGGVLLILTLIYFSKLKFESPSA